MRLLPISRIEQQGIKSWKIIQDHPDYAISNYGEIMRITNGHWPNNAKRGVILKPAVGSHGYYNLNLGRNARGVTIHVIVAIAFIGPRPYQHVCNHKDGNKLNNHISNLEWITKSEDIQHAYDNGLHGLRIITYNNISLTAKQWGRRLGISGKTLLLRLRRGWSIKRTVTTHKKINQYG